MVRSLNTRIGIVMMMWGLSYLIVYSQDFSLLDAKFYSNGQEIKNALSGGLNSPQFNAIDINLDGLSDVLVFDRVGNVVLPFINKSNSPGEINYQYDPSFKYLFDGVSNWVRIRDYNNDMIPDIFSAGRIPGIEMRKGSIVEGKLQFEKLVFDQGAEDVIYYQLTNGSWTQVFVSINDLPEIIDVDKDGDLDLLTYEPNGGKFVYFYSNQSIEDGVGLDSLYFKNIDFCFGKFKESGVSQQITLSPNPDDCADGLWSNESEVRHDGSTLTALDKNEDGLYDLLVGDLTSPNIVYLQNGGSLENAWINELDDSFPRNDVPVDLNIFNAAFYLDVNNDGREDLIISPNYRTASAENHNCAWYYEDLNNVGEAAFAFQKENLFVEDMIDMGAGSNPTFTDYNADGLLDLVVGSVGFYDPLGSKIARLYMFENTGTETNPEFSLVDEDYLGFSQFNATSNNYAPTFGDLDDDGDEDLLIGDNKGALYFLENIAGPDAEYDFENAVYQYLDIDVGENSKPQIIDVNMDGLSDILIGERNGNPGPDELNYAINYFQNIGSVGNPVFESDPTISPNNPTFGIVNTRDFGFSTPSSSPYLVYLPEKEDFILFCGSESGRIKTYDNIVANIDDAFPQVDEQFGGFFEGKRTTVSVADIDNDGFLEIAIGNDRGGIGIYNTPLVVDSGVPTTELGFEHQIDIYPNPVVDILNISLPDYFLLQSDFAVYNSVGTVVKSGKINSNKAQLDVSKLSAGIYFIRISNDSEEALRKVVITK